MTDHPHVQLVRGVFDTTAAALGTLAPEDAYAVARDLLVEYRRLAERALDLRDVQVSRVYDGGSMTLDELGRKLRWGAGQDGAVTRGRMSQVVTRGRALRLRAAEAEQQEAA